MVLAYPRSGVRGEERHERRHPVLPRGPPDIDRRFDAEAADPQADHLRKRYPSLLPTSTTNDPTVKSRRRTAAATNSAARMTREFECDERRISAAAAPTDTGHSSTRAPGTPAPAPSPRRRRGIARSGTPARSTTTRNRAQPQSRQLMPAGAAGSHSSTRWWRAAGRATAKASSAWLASGANLRLDSRPRAVPLRANTSVAAPGAKG